VVVATGTKNLTGFREPVRFGITQTVPALQAGCFIDAFIPWGIAPNSGIRAFQARQIGLKPNQVESFFTPWLKPWAISLVHQNTSPFIIIELPLTSVRGIWSIKFFFGFSLIIQRSERLRRSPILLATVPFR